MYSKMNKPSYLLVIAGLFMALIWGSVLTRQANALCAEQPEAGSWVNSDPSTRSLTQAELRFTCQDVVLNGEPYPPGPPWHIHLWGACSPTDCDWTEVGARTVTVGSRTFVFAIYHQGFATRYVYADMSLYRPDQLWVWMWTNFTDPSRPDYASQNWFIRR